MPVKGFQISTQIVRKMYQEYHAKVSVITPVFNGEKYIAETIQSILNQTYKNIELIVVNDGSTDKSEEIIHSFKDERIVYFKRENKGQAAASNFGLSKATGDYIKFFDADDIMNAEHIEFQLNKIGGRVDAIASCEWGRFYDGNPMSAIFKAEPVWKDMKPFNWLKTALSQKADMMPAWLWLIPKQIIQNSGGWDERLSLNNDFEFSIRLLLHSTNVLFAEGAKAYYRSGIATSLALSTSKKSYEAAFLSTSLGCNQLLGFDNTDEIKRLCANRYQLWIYRIYPDYPDLLQKFEAEIKKLGGSNLHLDASPFIKILSSVIGWKSAKKLKRFIQR
jgi:glycosyltransferase involved in cell wall biosynthesis